VSVKQEPIDDEQEKSPVTEKNLSIPENVIPESAVVYGPHQLEPLASLFTKIDLFNIIDFITVIIIKIKLRPREIN